MSSKRWKSCGYLAKSRTGANVIIMIDRGRGVKEYYIADLKEALEVLTGNLPFTQIIRRIES